MVVKTWNSFPDTVRSNLISYYYKGNRMAPSIIECIWRDHDLLWYSSLNKLDQMSRVGFTEEQWSMFLLKWS